MNGRRGWSWLRVLAYLAIFACVYIATQLVAIAAVGTWDAWGQPEFDFRVWRSGITSNGFALSVFTCASVLTCVPLLRVLVGLQEPRPWDFLGFRPCPARDILVSCGAMALLTIASDLVTVALGRPVVPPFMAEAYATARYPALLFLTLVVAAPLLEELFFRGFLFGGLRACGASLTVAGAVVTLAFAALHTQYDVYGVTIVFLIGLLLIGARVRFDSIVPCLAMHGVANAIAFVETVLIRSRL